MRFARTFISSGVGGGGTGPPGPPGDPANFDDILVHERDDSGEIIPIGPIVVVDNDGNVVTKG